MRKKRNILKTITAFALAGMILYGCRTGEKITGDKPGVKLTESQQREYNYALTEATKQKLFGNYKQAVALYRKCIEVNPRSDAAYFQLSGIYLIGRNLKEAKEMNRKATHIAPDNYWYKIQLAQIYMMMQQSDSAAMVYEDILSQWPEKIEVRFELSRLYSEMGKSSRALKMLSDIEEEKGLSEPVSMLKEQIYVREGKYENAIDELNKLIEAAPEEIRYMGILAELYTTLERKEEARKTYRRIFEIEPENGIAQLSMAEFYRMDNNPEMQFKYLKMAFRNKSLAVDRKMSAVIEFLTSEPLFRENKRELDTLITIMTKMYPEDYRVKTARADFLAKQERYQEALEVYNQVIDDQKENYFIWEQTIFIENILGNTEKVYEKCTEALKYFPDKPFLYLFKGNAAIQKGENKEAIRSLEEGLKYVQNNIPLKVQFYSFLAESWRNMENHEKSDEYFDKALEMEPENVLILNNYGYYLALREEKLDKAEEMSRKTILVEPENATYLDTYAWILFKAKHLDEARKYMEKALQFGGNEDPDILEHYGDILKALEKTEEAVNYWEKAIEKGGNRETIERKISEYK